MARQETEEYRRAALGLAAAGRQFHSKAVIVASATRGEGATSTAVHIGRHMQKDAGLNPVVLEMNRLRPALHKVFGLDSFRSLEQMLSEGAPALEQVQRDSTGLAMIPAGVPQTLRPWKMSLEQTLCHAVQELQNHFDVILVDAPPVLESADVLVAGRVVRHVLLVVGSGRASQDQLRRACQQLEDARIQLAGTILNSRRRFIPRIVERVLAQ